MVLCFYMMRSSGSALSAPLRAIAILLVCLACVAGGYELGAHQYAQGAVPAGEGHVTGQGSVGTNISSDVDFSTFWDVWKLVRESYVDQPVSEKELYYGAMAGMVGALNDPYSTYFNPTDAQAFDDQLAGSFFGIGAQLDVKDGQIVVTAALPNTPAEKAGLQSEDAIMAIDGVSTEGMVIDDAVAKIRGAKGTTVTLSVVHKGADTVIDVPIVRDEITIDSVTYAMKDDHVAVISVSLFNDDTSKLFAQAVASAEKDGAKSIVLDLRSNPGGLLDAAIDLAGYWIPAGGTAVIEDVRGDKTEYRTHGDGSLAAIPTVVLVNGGSASASEILAGALQDTHEAEVIGEQTFGKGSVQQFQDLPDGGAVKITVAHWLTPLGRTINKQGVTPDKVVPFTAEDAHANLDPQFDAAIDFLQTQ